MDKTSLIAPFYSAQPRETLTIFDLFRYSLKKTAQFYLTLTFI